MAAHALCLQAALRPAGSMDIRPNHTIYINNINDKIKKEGTGGHGARFPQAARALLFRAGLPLASP